MPFSRESDFEEALIKVLSEKGWEKKVLKYYDESQLIKNWADILFENNRGIDRLNDFPLTDGEMRQIIEQIEALRTPLKLNGFINGRTVTIVRDNPEDTLHLGKEVSLKIYDRLEIAAGQSRYQIVQQPKFSTKSKMLNDRRGDLMLLINGMPVIHIELKKSSIPVSEACNQIEKYAAEGVFSGIFSLVQVFVAMNPDDTVYFANPGPEGKFNSNFYFHWADFNNEPITDWKQIATTFLSIPMAHELIGFYTVADDSDGILKVMRSYQYYAANAIADKVAKTKWEERHQLGGFVWHTTGSGKTMTSFKSAQMIASSKDADKVIFLMDRIELGTQSLKEYRNFANENEAVQATENTGVLVSKLKSIDPSDTLIVTSIQKMSNIKDEDDGGLKKADIEYMKSKRIVFIVDECHRSTFGDMLLTIKHTFPKAIFFGFTGTPIHKENQKRLNTTVTVFGDELHRYSIADGIRDKNVLGFDPYKVLTYKDRDLRTAVALEKAKASTVKEALELPEKREVFYHYFKKLPMAYSFDSMGNKVDGVEDYLPKSQYSCDTHHEMVVKDIIDNWLTLSYGGKFHAILATASISEAIQYYSLLKKKTSDLKFTALFDPSIDNRGTGSIKEDSLVEIIQDYNSRYSLNFTIPTFAKMKKDIAARLAHKKPYQRIENEPDEQLDLLIVVDQMLTGYDSKWINTLYLDKIIKYENIIQAFSRTNRLFGKEKPFGTIRYYRKPHTMYKYIEEAVKLYSGDKPFGIFVDRLPENLHKINELFQEIKGLFENSGIRDFSRLPKEIAEKRKFASLFNKLNIHLRAARIQGFTWDKKIYEFIDNKKGKKKKCVEVLIDQQTYDTLLARYRELQREINHVDPDLPYEIDGSITEINTTAIDADYMNSRFDKYLKLLTTEGTSLEAIKQAEDTLHKTFLTLSSKEQKYANLFLHDIQRGDVIPKKGKKFRDYIVEYMEHAKDSQIHRLSLVLGLDETKLREMMAIKVTDSNINEYGRFDTLKATVDRNKAKEYFETIEGIKIIPPKVPQKVDKLLRSFVLTGGFDIQTLE